MFCLSVLAVLLFTFTTWTLGLPSCDQNAEVCEYTFVVAPKFTMMDGKVLIYAHNGSLYAYTDTDPSTATPVPVENVITTDGFHTPRMVVLVNGKLPGSAIEVWENQMVTVHVMNNLHSDAVTIHWHGLHQSDTPYMDGVAFVSQCPILPGQTFTYRFKAYPRGTFWYHSHIGGQRTMGLYGPIIIHERQPKHSRLEEFVWSISDWNHEYDSEEGYYKMVYGIYEGRSKYKGTGSLDGSFFSMFRFHSGLLNGRGRYYDPETGEHNGAPLSSFSVTQGKSYRVRVISVGELYPFRISVDDHPITVIASDGYYLEAKTVESFIINPGERYDFVINATQPVGNYWIRGETLEVGMNHTLEAILHYEGAPENMDPTTARQNCTKMGCVVVNCPFTFYPFHDNTSCISFDQLKAAVADYADPSPTYTKGNFEEQFLNFAFPGINEFPGSINGRAYQSPVVSAVSQYKEIDTQCSNPECGEDKVCTCTWVRELTHEKTYQLVMLNMGKGKGWSHPIHLHGHSFYVLKMGYARYNETTGKLIGDNLDIDCRGNPNRTKSFCNDATWADSTWRNGNIPGLELQRPPRKDTLIIPTGGYAVIRFKADNPGLWMMHCHIQIHNLDGMVMLFNESFPNLPDVPEDFPTCGNFWNRDRRPEPTEPSRPKPTEPDDKPMPKCSSESNMYSMKLFWGVVGCLIAISVILFIILVVYMCLNRPSGGRSGAYNLEPMNGYSYENKGAIT